MLPASALPFFLALTVHAPPDSAARLPLPSPPPGTLAVAPFPTPDRSADSLLIQALRQQLATGDSLMRLTKDSLARSRDSLGLAFLSLRRSDSLLRSETRRKIELNDSLGLFKRPDSLTLRIDTLAVLDPAWAPDTLLLRESIEHAALKAGFSVRRRPQLAGLRNDAPLRAWLDGKGDSAWIKLDLNGRSVTEGTRIEDTSSVPRLQRDALRSLFGKDALPPEPPAPWHWSLRAAALLSVLLASSLTVLCLW